MDLQSFLQLLRVDRGPSTSGEYVCTCPAHEDQTASLCVREGEKGLVVKCQAGCTTDAVCKALGIRIKDLFYASKDTAKTARRAAAAKGSKPAAAPPPPAKEKTQTKSLGRVERVHVYRDADGQPIFEVVKFRADDGSKTFRPRRQDPAQPGKTIWSLPDELSNTLYQLPELLAAIEAKATVFVVEGEKDAETMAALGYVATTNPGGAGKWKPAHTEQLRGADVVILPDCDVEENKFAGQKHGQHVAAQLYQVAARVRVIDLKAGCPELPAKGDITDFFSLLGEDDGRKRLSALLGAAEDWEPDLRERAIAAYDSVPGFHIHQGCIAVPQEEGYRKLATFMAAPRAEITRDDGVTCEKVYLIEGWTGRGIPLGGVRVPAAKFASLAWVGESWGFAANIMPGTTTKDKLRYVIAEVGNMLADHITEYSHTGWRRIGGQWAYLYQGGAIGCAQAKVDLGNGLTRYTLDTPCDMEIPDACRVSYALQSVISDHVAIPLLGMMYLAPVRSMLEEIGHPPSYSLFLLGATGTRKSTATALALSHYGDFDNRSMPASFNDTANSVRGKAFALKDMPIVVDDYHPTTSLQERRRMEATAQSLSRAFGDGAERARLGADLMLRAANPPRGVAILSGEDMPNIGQSGTARYYVVHMTGEDVPICEELSNMQDKAKAGVLRKAMRGYIKWLLIQMDDMPAMLKTAYTDLRRRAIRDGKGDHARVPEVIAHLMLGYTLMMMYMRDQGVFDVEYVTQELERAWRVISANSSLQGAESQAERPSKMFLSAISELIAARAVSVRDLGNPEAGIGKDMIGYCDARFYYLMPERSYTVVTKMYADQGQAFPLTRTTLNRMLRDDGLIEVDEVGARTSKVKAIDGKAIRLLWVRREVIDGTKLVREQQKMQLNNIQETWEGDAWPEGRE